MCSLFSGCFQGECLNWEKRKRTFLEVAKGLAYLDNLHPQIIHGAVKAKNVLMESDLTPQLMDYGVAHYMQRRRMSPTLTNVDWVLRPLLLLSLKSKPDSLVSVIMLKPLPFPWQQNCFIRKHTWRSTEELWMQICFDLWPKSPKLFLKLKSWNVFFSFVQNWWRVRAVLHTMVVSVLGSWSWKWLLGKNHEKPQELYGKSFCCFWGQSHGNCNCFTKWKCINEICWSSVLYFKWSVICT